MSSKVEGKMNVARPRGSWRASAWIALAAFLLLAVIMVVHLVGQSDESNIVFGIIVLLAFAIGWPSLTRTVVALASPVYYWDEERVKWKRLWRERSMRWDEVSTVRVKESTGELTYVLTDAWSRRLTLDVKSLGGDHPLHLLLKQKLHRLLEGETNAVQAAARTEFPVRLLGVNFGTFILGEDSLTAKGRFRTRELPLDELSEVRQIRRRADWETYHEAQLVWKDGSKIWIPHFTTGLFRLLESLRSRAANAVWYKPRGPEPESKPAKIAFWRHRIDRLRRSRKQMLLSDLGLIVLLALFLARAIARRGWPLPREIMVLLGWPAVLLGCGIWLYATYPRRLRKLQGRLAEVETRAEDGPPESVITQEDLE